MPHDAARQCTVSGGSGSTEANLLDMRTAAGRLTGSGVLAGGLCTSVMRVAASLPAKSALLSPGSAAGIAEQIAGLVLELGRLGLRMEFVASTLRWSATAYELTDAAQRNALAAVNVLTSPVRLGKAGAEAMLEATTTTPLPRLSLHDGDRYISSWRSAFGAALSRRVIQDPSLYDGAVIGASSFIGTVAPGAGAPTSLEHQISFALWAGRLFGYFNDSRPLSVRETGEHTAPAKQRQLTDVVRDATDAEYRSTKDHSVLTVRRVVGPDGTGSWVVNVPGTSHFAMTSDHGPSDATADLATMSGSSSSLYPAIDRAVTSAMRESGVAPGSEPVMLAGHSLGGIVAARMAADPAYRTKFDIREVVTVGSPVSRIHVPREVQVLSVENVHDLVPRLDGAPNPDTTNRVTAICETPAGEQLHTLLDAHDGHRYDRSTAELSADHDPQLRDWYSRNDRFLAGREIDFEFQLRRDDP